MPTLPEAGGRIRLPQESLEHVHVLRLEAGADVELFDGTGRLARGELVQLTRREAECVAEAPVAVPARSPRLQLIVGLPKAAKLETIVRMTTELGVAGIHVAATERSVPKPGAETAKLERLQRIAREACAQSGNVHLPVVRGPQPLLAAAAAAPSGARKFVFWEEAGAPLPAAIGGQSAEIWAVIGPEGGLSAAETSALTALGYAPIGLGSHILRVETACVVIAAVLLDRSGGLQG